MMKNQKRKLPLQPQNLKRISKDEHFKKREKSS